MAKSKAKELASKIMSFAEGEGDCTPETLFMAIKYIEMAVTAYMTKEVYKNVASNIQDFEEVIKKYGL